MAEKPADKCNWEQRKYIKLGPKFLIDANNPRMGTKGNLTYLMYASTDSKDKSSISLAEDGTWSVYNDRSIEIVAGEGNESPKGQDIVITSKTGEIVIQADGTGSVRIKATNISLEASEDIDIKAGRNLTLSATAGQTLVTGPEMNVECNQGNVADSMKTNILYQIFAGSFVGLDAIFKIIGGPQVFNPTNVLPNGGQE